MELSRRKRPRRNLAENHRPDAATLAAHTLTAVTLSASKLILSVFPGIGLLDRAFEDCGFCIVRGPDLIFGGDIHKFSPPAGHFWGIIGGPPCQKFSLANRARSVTDGMELVNEYLRCVQAAAPDWFLMENVAGSPTVAVPGYVTQVFHLDASQVGSEQHRLRKFHYGHKPGTPELVLKRDRVGHSGEPTCLASEGRRRGRRSWTEFCRLQGLPDGFDLPGFTVQAKYQAVGNGVPYPLALALARAIQFAGRAVTPHRLCECGCGQYVSGKSQLATVACRKRMQRVRDAGRVTVSGSGIVSQLTLVATSR